MTRFALVKVGDVVTIKGGGTPTKSKMEFYTGDIPWVTPKDMKTWEITSAQDNITDDAIRQSATNLVPENTVLVVNRSGILKHTLPVAITRRPVAINQDMKALICSDSVDSDYLARMIKSAEPTVLSWVRATTADNFPIENLKSLSIPLPPLAEQKRIAAILDQADSLRRLRQRAIDRLNSLGQAIFYEMFGDPARASSGFKNGKLSSVAELINGDRSANYPSGDELVGNGILFLGTKNICGSEIILKDCSFITEEKFRTLTRGKLKRKDLVITLRGTIGQCAVFDCCHDTGFINAQIMIIRPTEIMTPAYLQAFISDPRTQAKLTQDRTGSAVPQLTAKQIGEIVVPIPSMNDQIRFADRLKELRSLRSTCNSHLQGLRNTFLTLQHRAFQGEL